MSLLEQMDHFPQVRSYVGVLWPIFRIFHRAVLAVGAGKIRTLNGLKFLIIDYNFCVFVSKIIVYFLKSC